MPKPMKMRKLKQLWLKATLAELRADLDQVKEKLEDTPATRNDHNGSVFKVVDNVNTEDYMDNSQLEGFKMSLIEAALDKCHAALNELCVFKSARIIKSNWKENPQDPLYRTEAQAIVESIDHLSLSTKGHWHSWEDQQRAKEKMNMFEALSIKRLALSKAIDRCKLESRFCVILDIIYIRNNDPFSGEYYTKALATVQGFNLKIGDLK